MIHDNYIIKIEYDQISHFLNSSYQFFETVPITYYRLFILIPYGMDFLFFSRNYDNNSLYYLSFFSVFLSAFILYCITFNYYPRFLLFLLIFYSILSVTLGNKGDLKTNYTFIAAAYSNYHAEPSWWQSWAQCHKSLHQVKNSQSPIEQYHRSWIS